MHSKRLIAALTLLCVVPVILNGADTVVVELPWTELGPRVTGRKVALDLQGAQIEGKVRAVEPQGLRLRVTRTSDRDAQPKGERVVPREAVSVLYMTEYRGFGRLLVTVGALGAAGGILAAKYPSLYEGTALIVVPVVAAAGMIGIAIGAYYAGKRLDRRITEIRIRP